MNKTLKRPIVFFDTETTGTDVLKDQIVELSMIKINIDGKVEPRTKRFRPTIPISKEAQEVTGITNEDLEKEQPFSKYATGILDFIIGTDLAGYNIIRFDVPMLFMEFNRADRYWNYKNHRLIDVMNLYKTANPRNLSAAYKQYTGNDLEGAHGAEADTFATIAVFEGLENEGLLQEQFKDIDTLAKASNFDNEIIDLQGKFARDADGDLIFTFGKHKNVKAKTQPGMLRWMLDKDFLPDAKMICKDLLGGK